MGRASTRVEQHIDRQNDLLQGRKRSTAHSSSTTTGATVDSCHEQALGSLSCSASFLTPQQCCLHHHTHRSHRTSSCVSPHPSMMLVFVTPAPAALAPRSTASDWSQFARRSRTTLCRRGTVSTLCANTSKPLVATRRTHSTSPCTPEARGNTGSRGGGGEGTYNHHTALLCCTPAQLTECGICTPPRLPKSQVRPRL